MGTKVVIVDEVWSAEDIGIGRKIEVDEITILMRCDPSCSWDGI
jgi:hypothetical protein